MSGSVPSGNPQATPAKLGTWVGLGIGVVGLIVAVTLLSMRGGSQPDEDPRVDDDDASSDRLALEQASSRESSPAGGRADDDIDQAQGRGGGHSRPADDDRPDGPEDESDRDDGPNNDGDSPDDGLAEAVAVDDEEALDDEEIPDRPEDDAEAIAAGDEADEDDEGTAPRPTPIKTDPDRSAESSMSAEELLAAAKEALDQGNNRDAYRLATSSVRKQPSEDGSLIRGKAACGLRNKGRAKDAMRTFKLTDDRRKAIRETCKANGIRVGL